MGFGCTVLVPRVLHRRSSKVGGPSVRQSWGECSADISSARNYGSFPLTRLTRFSKIVVGEEASVIDSFKPMARMDLIEVGSNKFLSQFLVLVAQERNLWPGECENRIAGCGIGTADICHFDGDANQCTVSSHRRGLRRQSWPGVICDATYRGSA
jgi:hypothetical protein